MAVRSASVHRLATCCRLADTLGFHTLARTLVVAAHVASAARADDHAADAKRHYARGVELVRDSLYAEAAVEFEAAYRAKPHFAVLYNLGQSYVALGRPVEALDALERYLRDGGSDIKPDRRDQITAELARQRGRVGLLALRIAQQGATVRVDGRELGRAPLAPVRLAVGAHMVELSLAGFTPRVVEVKIVGEETSTVELSLAPVAPPAIPPASGLVAATCPLADVVVELDGRPVGKAALSQPFGAAAGAHTVRFSRPGYATTSRAVAVRPNELVAVACDLVPERPLAPAHAARLLLRASEPSAAVSLDGAALPADGVVPMGAHEVAVSAPGFHPARRGVALAAGVTHALEVTLVPTDAFRASYEGRALARRRLAYAALGVGLAGVAAGAYLWRYNDGRHDRWQEEDDRLSAGYASKPPRPADLDQRQAANDDLIRSIQRTDKVTVGLLAGGAVLSTVGVVLWAAGDDPDRYARIGVAASPRGAAWAFTAAY